MREILIISGKGGTGKTSLTAAFAHLSGKTVICDLDVDAPDLHLILTPDPSEPTRFVSGFEPVIRPEACSNCGTCVQTCRFEAVSNHGDTPLVDPIRCEGCGVCVHFCPEKAIDFTAKECGHWRISHTRFGPMVHAQLYPGEENSGRLVALLRTEAKKLAAEQSIDLILSDGPPGIGCPVISAVSGVRLAVMVTEPTPTGIHDLKRVVALSDHFKVGSAVIINKCDLSPDIAGEIRSFCESRGIPVIAELPFDINFVEAMVQQKTITEFSESPIADRMRSAWHRILDISAQTRAAWSHPGIE